MSLTKVFCPSLKIFVQLKLMIRPLVFQVIAYMLTPALRVLSYDFYSFDFNNQNIFDQYIITKISIKQEIYFSKLFLYFKIGIVIFFVLPVKYIIDIRFDPAGKIEI